MTNATPVGEYKGHKLFKEVNSIATYNHDSFYATLSDIKTISFSFLPLLTDYLDVHIQQRKIPTA